MHGGKEFRSSTSSRSRRPKDLDGTGIAAQKRKVRKEKDERKIAARRRKKHKKARCSEPLADPAIAWI